MLKLNGITKDYLVGDNKVQALKGVDIAFRKSEFVSILGPSGCGKTTLLNIVGGLDKYTSGELFIDNISTKNYQDRDWDTYRNHRIGFVFQSYNLIPHQTISENVELALAISGVEKAERVQRAHEALDKVGLKGQYNKKPNQLSGGQCQRVAIARAIVNNPEILLADEPTGALDTVTSVQVMDLIKDISKECLVIMVTHNPELAEQYSTRIIRLLDGEVVADTAPFNGIEEEKVVADTSSASQQSSDNEQVAVTDNSDLNEKDLLKANDVENKQINSDNTSVEDSTEKQEKKEMFGNLIYGEALDIDDDKLNENLIIGRRHIPNQSIQETEDSLDDSDSEKIDIKKEKKNSKHKKAKLSFWAAFKLSLKNLLSKRSRTIMVSIAGSIGIIGVSLVLALSSGVRTYIDDMQNKMLQSNPVAVSEQAFDLNALMNGMTNSDKSEIIKKSIEDGYINVEEVIKSLVERSENMSAYQVTNNITKQYVDFVKAMPKENYAAISTEYGLNLSNNLYTEFKFDGATKNISLSAAKQTYKSVLESAGVDSNTQLKNFSEYFNLANESFMQAPSDNNFILSQYDIVSDKKTSKVATAANEIMIVVNDDSALSDLLLAQFGYFTQEEFVNIISKAFKSSDYKESLWKEKFSYNDLMNKKFVWYPNDSIYSLDLNASTADSLKCNYNPYVNPKWTGKELKITAILKPKEGATSGALKSGFYYTQALAEEAIVNGRKSQLVEALNQVKMDTITCYKTETGYEGMPIKYNYSYWIKGKEYSGNVAVVGKELDLTSYIGSMPSFGNLPNIGDVNISSLPKIYTLSIRELGGLDHPSAIKIYCTNFAQKDLATAYLDIWNSDQDIELNRKIIKAEDREEMTYTDNLAVVINMINTLIGIVTAALIAFTALSLVVSTVMIAIITYVSVIERIKEIGVIRSLGGRKRDVSALFNAETFIIGSGSGVIGLLMTYILSVVINQIVGHIFGIFTLASLPIWIALLMLLLSIGLTMIAGIIPASLAARKDPVNALRSE